jgi:hypothetical protein
MVTDNVGEYPQITVPYRNCLGTVTDRRNGQVAAEIFSISAVVEIAGVRGR